MSLFLHPILDSKENCVSFYAAPSFWTGRSTPREASWAARVQPSAAWRHLTLAPTLGHSCSHCLARSSDTAAWSSKSISRVAEGGSDQVALGQRLTPAELQLWDDVWQQLRDGPIARSVCRRPLNLTSAFIHTVAPHLKIKSNKNALCRMYSCLTTQPCQVTIPNPQYCMCHGSSSFSVIKQAQGPS